MNTNVLILLKEPYKENALLTLHVTIETHFSLRKSLNNIMHGLVVIYVMRWHFCWTTFFYILAQSCIRQFVGIPMGTYHCSLFADLFLFSYNSGFMLSLSDDKQAGIIDAFSTTPRYLDDILNMNNIYLTIWQEKIYPAGLQCFKANITEIEACFWTCIWLFLMIVFLQN